MYFKLYYYRLLSSYLSLYIRESDNVVEINPKNTFLKQYSLTPNWKFIQIFNNHPQNLENSADLTDYVILNGNLHYERDIQKFLLNIHSSIEKETRIIVVYYSKLWQPLIKLATKIGLRTKIEESNWLSHSDIQNLALLSNFQIVNRYSKVLFPVYIPFLSIFFNKYIVNLPFFRHLAFVNISILKPIKDVYIHRPSVSIVVPARNEAGNIHNIATTIPLMGESDELIFVEGNSSDQTWQTIQNLKNTYIGHLSIKAIQQDGKGKGDAVRKGFANAKNDILMIWDADMTVPASDLPKFYNAIIEGKGEFINGSRLVYPMENEAMRFFNILGNKFFAISFSYVLNQQIKDTLCGTKVLTKKHYEKIASHRSYFGNFDPFGDFDLLFGATRLGLKIIEIPIEYRARTYGETNISRWTHGVILLRMLLFAANKITFK